MPFYTVYTTDEPVWGGADIAAARRRGAYQFHSIIWAPSLASSTRTVLSGSCEPPGPTAVYVAECGTAHSHIWTLPKTISELFPRLH